MGTTLHVAISKNSNLLHDSDQSMPLSISCIDLQVGIRFFSQRLSGLSFCLSVCFSKRKDEIDSFSVLITSMLDLLYFPSY